MCGGANPPTSKRADFIIPACNGQAFCLFFLFCALTEESEHIHFFTVDEDTRTFRFKVGDQDRAENSLINRDEVSAFIGNDGSKIETTSHFKLSLYFIDLCRNSYR